MNGLQSMGLNIRAYDRQAHAEIVAALERHRASLSDRLEADVTLSAAVVNLVRTYLRVPRAAGKSDKKGARSS